MQKSPFSQQIRSAALALTFVCLLWLTACSPSADVSTEAANQSVKPLDLDAMVHPDLKAELSAMPKQDTFNLEAMRKDFVPDEKNFPKSEKIEVYNKAIATDGNPSLRLRVYRPKQLEGEYPAILWIHGGGHFLGAPENDEATCLWFAEEIGCIVVSPDYRLAPENPYPADVEDCFAALKWMADTKANSLPIDTSRIAVAGSSAGGGLTISTALKARDAGGPKICFMLPIYPMLDYRNNTISARQITDPRVLSHSANAAAWKMYLGDIKNVPAYASPALAEDVSGLPPANILVGSLDPFRDENISFAQRMLDAGITVELHVIPGAFHAFDTLGTPLSNQAMDEHLNALKNALRRQ
ncbi:alpha/beta hydrolase [bacterium]|nr:alpha/beta hydrolase [bacterium]